MRTNRKHGIESLERREVFSGMPLSGGLIPEAPVRQVSTEKIVYESNLLDVGMSSESQFFDVWTEISIKNFGVIGTKWPPA